MEKKLPPPPPILSSTDFLFKHSIILVIQQISMYNTSVHSHGSQVLIYSNNYMLAIRLHADMMALIL